jgi:hypothetical protein
MCSEPSFWPYNHYSTANCVSCALDFAFQCRSRTVPWDTARRRLAWASASSSPCEPDSPGLSKYHLCPKPVRTPNQACESRLSRWDRPSSLAHRNNAVCYYSTDFSWRSSECSRWGLNRSFLFCPVCWNYLPYCQIVL